MSTREEIVYVCDLCGAEATDQADIRTHQLVIDGAGFEAEACESCWWKALKGINPLSTVARPLKLARQPAARAKKVKAYRWPGETWKFTAHAMERMGQRHLDPTQVIEAIEDAATVRPGRDEGVEVRYGRNGLSVALNPTDRVILTAAER